MKYEEFVNQIIDSLVNKRFLEGDGYYICLDNINIKMNSSIPEDITDRKDGILRCFKQDYPDFTERFHITGFNDDDISVRDIELFYNGSLIFKQEFYAIAMGSGSGHNIMLPQKDVNTEKNLIRAICSYYTGEVNIKSLMNIF
jgi:hypothetical protein